MVPAPSRSLSKSLIGLPTRLSRKHIKRTLENPILDGTYTIDPDAYITVQLLKPGDYVISVGVAGQQMAKNINYATDNCNMQCLSIGFISGESVESFSMSTSMACMSVNTVATGTPAMRKYD